LGQVRDSARTPLVSLLLEGGPGAGKTALAAFLALKAEFPYMKLISAEGLVNQTEAARAYKLVQAFEDAYRSPVSVVLLDNLERLVSYVKIGPRFSNEMLQMLLVLIQRAPPKGHRCRPRPASEQTPRGFAGGPIPAPRGHRAARRAGGRRGARLSGAARRRRLLVVGTTSNLAVLEQLELAGPHGVFNSTITVALRPAPPLLVVAAQPLRPLRAAAPERRRAWARRSPTSTPRRLPRCPAACPPPRCTVLCCAVLHCAALRCAALRCARFAALRCTVDAEARCAAGR
jgi:hypothetical protein